jgi:hypothetical protein
MSDASSSEPPSAFESLPPEPPEHAATARRQLPTASTRPRRARRRAVAEQASEPGHRSPPRHDKRDGPGGNTTGVETEATTEVRPLAALLRDRSRELRDRSRESDLRANFALARTSRPARAKLRDRSRGLGGGGRCAGGRRGRRTGVGRPGRAGRLGRPGRLRSARSSSDRRWSASPSWVRPWSVRRSDRSSGTAWSRRLAVARRRRGRAVRTVDDVTQCRPAGRRRRSPTRAGRSGPRPR